MYYSIYGIDDQGIRWHLFTWRGSAKDGIAVARQKAKDHEHYKGLTVWEAVIRF